MRHQTRSVRRNDYLQIAAIALHPQGDPPELGFRVFSKPKNPRSVGRFRAPSNRGGATRYCTRRADRQRDRRARRRGACPPPRPTVDVGPLTALNDRLAAHDRPQPDLADYDQLIGGQR